MTLTAIVNVRPPSLYRHKPSYSVLGPSAIIRCLPWLILLLLLSCTSESKDVKFKRLMGQAEQFTSEGKLEEARISLQNAAQLIPDNAAAYFELAEVLARQKNYEQALVNYQTAINIDPAHHTARLHLSALLFAAGKDEIAESGVRKVLEQDPKNANAQALLANIFVKRGNVDQASVIFDEILSVDAKNIGALAGKANIALGKGDAKQAEELFAKALEADPANGPIQLALVQLYTAQGRQTEAEELLATLVERNPGNNSLRFYFADFLMTQGLGEKAISEFEKTLLADPMNQTSRDRLYDLYVYSKEFEKARALTADLAKLDEKNTGLGYFKARDQELDGNLEAALKLHLEALPQLSKFAPAYRRTGIIELALGNQTKGLEHLIQATIIDSIDVGARLALAHYFFKQRDLSLASEHTERVLERYPRQIGANILRADIALVEGNTKRAEQVYNLLVESFPNSPKGYIKLGLLEEQKGNTPAAIEHYRKVLSFDRDVGLALRRFAVLTAKEKGTSSAITELTELSTKSKNAVADYKTILARLVIQRDQGSSDSRAQARTLLKEALSKKPDLLEAYFLLAQLDAEEGKLGEARKNYEKLVELKPKDPAHRMLLAMTLERERDFNRAIDEYRAVLQLDPRFGPAANNLAWLLAEEVPNGDLDEALRVARVAQETLPKQSAVADTLGWVYHKKGSNRAALPLIEDAIELETTVAGKEQPNPEMLYHLGAVRLSLGDKKGAKEALEQALTVGGEHTPKKQEINRLLEQLG